MFYGAGKGRRKEEKEGEKGGREGLLKFGEEKNLVLNFCKKTLC